MTARNLIRDVRAAVIARQRHSRSSRPSSRDESGAILVLALVFLVAVSLIVVGMLSWVGTSLIATASFTNERSAETAATSAVNLAIQKFSLHFFERNDQCHGS